MRIPESDFSQTNAEAALKDLQLIVAGKIVYDWMSVANLQVVVRGYVLRRDAMAATGDDRKFKVAKFCRFLHSEAYWRD